MLSYNQEHSHIHQVRGKTLYSFISGSNTNIDNLTVRSFGEEWEKFDDFGDSDMNTIAAEYLDIITPGLLNTKTILLDAGCGSGRWSRYLAPKLGFIEAIDPSDSVLKAVSNPNNPPNLRFTQAAVDNIPFPDQSFDMIICLGVLHHTPDPYGNLRNLVRKLKTGGHLLLYLYYALENRSAFYRLLFGFSTGLRKIISRLPGPLKRFTCDMIAILVYWPLTRTGKILKTFSPLRRFIARWPLAYYQNKSFLILRNDSLDRFGTPLEKRFTKNEMERMMIDAGLDNITFSEKQPFYHALGHKPPSINASGK